MNSKILAKYAEQKNLNIKILKIWEDGYSNLLVVFETGGRKYGVVGKDDPNDLNWNYFRGVGVSKVTKDMPAGRGDYLVAEKVDAPILEQILEAINTQGVQREFVDNKSNVSWSPKNETEKENLVKLIQKWGEVNEYISQSGFGYTGGDKLIYGEDITAEDVLSWKIPKPAVSSTSKSTSISRRTSAPNLDPKDEEYWREKFYNTVASQIGVPYYWGGDDPGKGFDCSGLIHWALDKSGLVPGAPDDVAGGQMNYGRGISQAELKKGDFIGFQTERGTRHIGIYTGEGTSYISALGGDQGTHGDNPNAKVKVSDFTRDPRQRYFSSIDLLIQKRVGSKQIS
jgi:cell wall-associated NlpC family hydrolase